MASGFPLLVADVHLRTSEALYQACRFPHRPGVQSVIIAQRSPMTAKMKSRAHLDETRSDWDQVRVRVMRWCLRVKLAQHPESFGQVLADTDSMPIVEESRRDDYWGAIRRGHDLVGHNVLGRLLMELRAEWLSGELLRLDSVPEPDVADFRLLGRQIGRVANTANPADSRQPDSTDLDQPRLSDSW